MAGETVKSVRPAPMVSNHPDENVRAAFNRMYLERAEREAAMPEIRAKGKEALGRLFKVASTDTGQAGVVAAFLLGLYNGPRFKFDLTELRRLDWSLHDDCLAVLRMDHTPQQEIHQYFVDGGHRFEQMARNWGIVGDASVTTGD